MTKNVHVPKNPLVPSIRRLFKLAGPVRSWFFLAAGLAVLQTGCTIAWNFTLARSVDAITRQESSAAITYLLITAALFLIIAPLAYFRTLSIGQFSERTHARLRAGLASHATVLPIGYLEARHTGDLLSIANADLARLKDLTSSALLDVFRGVLMGVSALVALFVISWQLALVSTILIPLMIVIMGQLSMPIARQTEVMQTAIGDTMSLAQDSFSGILITRAFNLTSIMDSRFRHANRTVLQKGLRLNRLRAATDGGGSFFNVLPFLLTFGFGGYLTITGSLTFGLLTAFINMLNFVANPLGELPPIIARISEAIGAAQRLFSVLDQPPERTSGENFAALKEAPITIRFEEVAFAYEKDPILQGVSFQVERGQTVAVVGPSGGGKSTLLKLLLGYYPPTAGKLWVFGRELNEWSLSALRDQMAFVAQDTYLFPVSIAENIACGRPGASQVEIEQAARLANIHDYILTLPHQYQTLAGERGARLSGGQRQRLSIARAILKNAPILLLDEPTSALDSESEMLVQEALERFMVDRTTIVIAHRLKTVRSASRVVVLEDGKIIEEGTHASLMQQPGRYRDLYLRQLEASVAVEEAGRDSHA
ncbi:MAG TPA: ABC transporter ATP-binding protein [Anaerolineaceae bacterium]